MRNFDKVKKNGIKYVLEAGAGLGKTNVELQIKHGLSKLLSWLLNILNFFSFISSSKSPEGLRDVRDAIV